MNLTWAFIISLLASLVGGVLSGLLVLRKTNYDLKRLYANQIYDDYRYMYGLIFLEIFIRLESFGCQGGRNISLDDENRSELIKIALASAKEWLQIDGERLLAKRDVHLLKNDQNELVKTCVDSEAGIKSFITKYPTQASYFDKLYNIASMADALNLEIDEDQIPIVKQYINDCQIVLDIVLGLEEVFSEIQHYRKAKSWTWRLFVPLVRN